MKIDRITFYKYGIYVIILLNLGCLNFIFHSFFISVALSLLISVVLFITYLLQKDKYRINSLCLKIYVFMELIILFIEYFRIQNNLNSSMTNRELFGPFGTILLLVISFPAVEVLNKESDRFLKGIAIIGYSVLFLRFTVWFMYNFLHINFGFEYMGGRITWLRPLFNGMLLTRTMGTFIDGYLMVYSSVNLYLKRKEWKKYILGIAFLLFYEAIVFQSRSQFLFFILTFIFTSLVSAHFSKYKLLKLLTLLLVILCITVIFFNNIQAFVDSFSTNSQYGESTLTRVLEYTFFSNLWKNTSLFLGFGMTQDIFELGMNKLYLSDLGLIAVLYQFGIIGFIISIMPFLQGIILSVKRWYQSWVTKIDYFTIVLTFYLLISSFNLNPYNYVFFPILPIYLGILFFEGS